MAKQSKEHSPTADNATAIQKRPHTRLVLAGLGVLLATLLIVGGIAYLSWLNSPARMLAQSFKNTLALDKTTYRLLYTNDGKDIAGLKSVTLNGQYAKDTGSRATADLVFHNSSYGLAITSDLALAKAGDTYYQYKKVTSVPGSDPSKQMSNELVSQILAAFGTQWQRLDSDTLQPGSSCAVAALQKMQTDVNLGETFVAALFGSGAVDIATISSQDNTAVYTITPKSDRAEAFVAVYTKTGTYKDLVACDEAHYKVTTASVKNALEQGEVEVTINKKSQYIEKFVFTHKQDNSTQKLDFTLTPTDKVDVVIPEVAADS